MRVYWSYDEQSSHEGYIDMCFKEISDNPNCGQLIYNAEELFYLTTDGYIYEGIKLKLPSFMCKLYDFECDYKKARISKRLIKKWCDRVIGEDKEPLAKEWAVIEADIGAIEDSIEEYIGNLVF